MPLPFELPRDKKTLRKLLQAERLTATDRMHRAVQLQQVLMVWLVGRAETAIGAYWPIKGEFDPLPALYRWQEAGEAPRPESYEGWVPEPQNRLIGLPVQDRETHQLRFHIWYPGCPMEVDAHDIPKPKATPEFQPQMLILPLVGFGPKGTRLGYGGGFYDRTLATLNPRPYTVGIGYAMGHVPWLEPEPHDVPLDTILTEEGVFWERDPD
jgi:5-formyltetrahydrofolate cyclo-ligase